MAAERLGVFGAVGARVPVDTCAADLVIVFEIPVFDDARGFSMMPGAQTFVQGVSGVGERSRSVWDWIDLCCRVHRQLGTMHAYVEAVLSDDQPLRCHCVTDGSPWVTGIRVMFPLAGLQGSAVAVAPAIDDDQMPVAGDDDDAPQAPPAEDPLKRFLVAVVDELNRRDNNNVADQHAARRTRAPPPPSPSWLRVSYSGIGAVLHSLAPGSASAIDQQRLFENRDTDVLDAFTLAARVNKPSLLRDVHAQQRLDRYVDPVTGTWRVPVDVMASGLVVGVAPDVLDSAAANTWRNDGSELGQLVVPSVHPMPGSADDGRFPITMSESVFGAPDDGALFRLMMPSLYCLFNRTQNMILTAPRGSLSAAFAQMDDMYRRIVRQPQSCARTCGVPRVDTAVSMYFQAQRSKLDAEIRELETRVYADAMSASRTGTPLEALLRTLETLLGRVQLYPGRLTFVATLACIMSSLTFDGGWVDKRRISFRMELQGPPGSGKSAVIEWVRRLLAAVVVKNVNSASAASWSTCAYGIQMDANKFVGVHGNMGYAMFMMDTEPPDTSAKRGGGSRDAASRENYPLNCHTTDGSFTSSRQRTQDKNNGDTDKVEYLTQSLLHVLILAASNDHAADAATRSRVTPVHMPHPAADINDGVPLYAAKMAQPSPQETAAVDRLLTAAAVQFTGAVIELVKTRERFMVIEQPSIDLAELLFRQLPQLDMSPRTVEQLICMAQALQRAASAAWAQQLPRVFPDFEPTPLQQLLAATAPPVTEDAALLALGLVCPSRLQPVVPERAVVVAWLKTNKLAVKKNNADTPGTENLEPKQHVVRIEKTHRERRGGRHRLVPTAYFRLTLAVNKEARELQGADGAREHGHDNARRQFDRMLNEDHDVILESEEGRPVYYLRCSLLVISDMEEAVLRVVAAELQRDTAPLLKTVVTLDDHRYVVLPLNVSRAIRLGGTIPGVSAGGTTGNNARGHVLANDAGLTETQWQLALQTVVECPLSFLRDQQGLYGLVFVGDDTQLVVDLDRLEKFAPNHAGGEPVRPMPETLGEANVSAAAVAGASVLYMGDRPFGRTDWRVPYIRAPARGNRRTVVSRPGTLSRRGTAERRAPLTPFITGSVRSAAGMLVDYAGLEDLLTLMHWLETFRNHPDALWQADRRLMPSAARAAMGVHADTPTTLETADDPELTERLEYSDQYKLHLVLVALATVPEEDTRLRGRWPVLDAFMDAECDWVHRARLLQRARDDFDWSERYRLGCVWQHVLVGVSRDRWPRDRYPDERMWLWRFWERRIAARWNLE
jgi:hypothetical protein